MQLRRPGHASSLPCGSGRGGKRRGCGRGGGQGQRPRQRKRPRPWSLRRGGVVRNTACTAVPGILMYLRMAFDYRNSSPTCVWLYVVIVATRVWKCVVISSSAAQAQLICGFSYSGGVRCYVRAVSGLYRVLPHFAYCRCVMSGQRRQQWLQFCWFQGPRFWGLV